MAKQKLIKAKCDFERQDKLSEYILDFNKTNKFKITFKDGYYVMITDKTEHILNDDDVEAVLFTPDKTKKSQNWVTAKPDEVQYTLYNWFMHLRLTNESNVYSLVFERGRPVGGGFL